MTVEFEGAITGPLVHQLMEEAREHPHFPLCRTHLVDLTGADAYKVTRDELIGIGSLFHDDYVDRAAPSLSVAIIATDPKPFGMSRLFISTAPTRGTRFNLFATRPEAEAWLQSQPPA
jgi:hypothetical protein